MAKYVYFFGGEKAEGGEQLRNLLGGKGAGLAEMVNLGIPVPPGFTITTEVCTLFYERRDAAPRRAAGRGPREPEAGGRADGHALRRPEEPAPSFDQIGGKGEHARHDGHGPQPRPQQRRR